MCSTLVVMVTGHAEELEASFCHHSINYSRAIISILTVQLFFSRWTPSTFRIASKEGEWRRETTALSKLWTGVTTSTLFNRSSSLPTSHCSRSLTKYISYIAREYEQLLSACEIILLSSHRKFQSAMFMWNTIFIHLVDCVMHYPVTFKMQYIVHLLHAKTYYIAGDMQSSQFMHQASLLTCCRYTGVVKLFLKPRKSSCLLQNGSSRVAEIMTWVSSVSMAQTSSCVMKRLWGCFSRMQKATSTTPLYVHCFTYIPCTILQRRCCLHIAVYMTLWTGGIDGLADPVSSEEFLKFKMENTEMHTSHGVTVLK